MSTSISPVTVKQWCVRLLLLSCFCGLALLLLLPSRNVAAAPNQFDSPLPTPIVYIYLMPETPAAQEDTYFYSDTYDPAELGIMEWFWDFGDGTTTTETMPYTVHRYAADGDYTVLHRVTTVDGRTATATKRITVRSYDIAITRFSRPQTAAVGQTKRLLIQVTNRSYPTQAIVELYKSGPNGFEFVGRLRQFVDGKRNGQTTNFIINYTFTQADAEQGKVVFRATTWPESGVDIFPADNEFITFATKVTRRGNAGMNGDGAKSEESATAAALDDYSDYSTDTVSNQAAELLESGTGTLPGVIEETAAPAAFKTYLPAIVMGE